MPRHRIRIAALLALLPVLALFGQDADPAARLKATLDDGRVVMEEFRDAIDASAYDVEALAKRLGPDPEAAYWFVRSTIGYEAYPGALRGAEGCLRSGAGNAVDRALLLAAVLRKNGHKARFAFAEAPKGKAEEWVGLSIEMGTGPFPLSFELPYVIDAPFFIEHCEKKEQELQERLVARHERLSAAIEQALGERAHAGKGGRAGTARATLVQEARDHVWVQVERDGAWADLDPMPDGPLPGQRVADPAMTEDEVPKELWHVIVLRGFVERFDGKRVSEQQVFEHEIPAAEAAGQLVVLETAPAGDAAGGVAEAVKGKDSRIALLRIGDRHIASGEFDLSATEGGLGGMLGGGKAKTSTLVSLGLEVGSRMGKRRGTTSRRYLVDRWGQAARSARDVKSLEAAPSQETVTQMDAAALCVAVQTGRVNAALVQQHVIENTLTTLAAFRIDGGLVKWAGASGDLSALILAETYFHFADRAAEAWLDRAGYAAEPRVVMLHVGSAGGKARLRFDVTQDAPRIVADGLEDAHRTQWEWGLISAIAEEEILPPPTGNVESSERVHGSAQALEDSLGRGPPVVIEEEDAIPEVPPDARALIRSALADRRIVLLPAKQPADGSFGWFELDQKTGVLLATVETGLHEGTAERGIMEKETPHKTAAARQYSSRVQEKFGCVAESVVALGSVALTAAEGGLPVLDALDLAQAMAECIAKAGKRNHRGVSDTPPKDIRIDPEDRTHIKDRHLDWEKEKDATKWLPDKDWEDYTRKTIDNPDRVYREAGGNWVYEKDFGSDILGSKVDGTGKASKVRAVVTPDGQGLGGSVHTAFPESAFNALPK